MKHAKTRPPKILYIQYTNPAAYPPLEQSSRLLANDGWHVLFLGTGAAGANILRFPSHPNITVEAIPFCPAGWRQKLHFAKYCIWVVVRAMAWRPNCVYASDIMACPAGIVLSFWPRWKFVYHEHDSPPQQIGGLFCRLLLWARTVCARRASICILPNAQRGLALAQQTRRHDDVICVWNCPRREEIAGPRTVLQPNDDLWILYHGSIVPQRLPETVLRALALVPPHVKLRVIGYETVGSKGYVDRLRQLAFSLGLAERVDFRGPLPREELLTECRMCDVGLSFMPSSSDDINMYHMTGASNKPFDYLACGLALLVSDQPEWRAMFVDAGFGLACDPEDAQSIANALDWYCHSLTELRAMGEAGRRRIQDQWNYETSFVPAWNQLQTACK